jgi:hypothetical protein
MAANGRRPDRSGGGPRTVTGTMRRRSAPSRAFRVSDLERRIGPLMRLLAEDSYGGSSNIKSQQDPVDGYSRSNARSYQR